MEVRNWEKVEDYKSWKHSISGKLFFKPTWLCMHGNKLRYEDLTLEIIKIMHESWCKNFSQLSNLRVLVCFKWIEHKIELIWSGIHELGVELAWLCMSLKDEKIRVYGKLGLLWYMMQLMFMRPNYSHLVCFSWEFMLNWWKELMDL